MGTFGFGNETEQVRRGKTSTVADYRLHIQEIWRIVRDGVILVGYGDYFYPPRGSDLAREDFVARDAPRTRRDDLIDDWFATTRRITSSARSAERPPGDLAITFRDACTLETFACSATTDHDGSDEFWRLGPPWVTGDERHFAVTAHGIER